MLETLSHLRRGNTRLVLQRIEELMTLALEQLVYECDGCGMCCRHLIVEASPLDALREPRIAAECLHLDGSGAAMKLTPAQTPFMLACVDPCKFLSDDNRCTIYGTRPDCCVGFPAGGEKCQELRVSHGLPLLTPKPVKEPTYMQQLQSEWRDAVDNDELE